MSAFHTPELNLDPAVATDPPRPDVPAAGRPRDERVADDFDRRVAALAPLYAASSRSLAWGFRVSIALLAAGLLLSLARDEPLSERAEPLPEVVSLVRDGHGAGLVDLGLIAMVLTPVVTVSVLAIGFLRIGDRHYALISLVVLAILAVSVGLALLR